MKHFTAWQAHTESVHEWIAGLVESGDADTDDIVWAGDDGSYAVGGWPGDSDEDADEMSDSGSVAEWLGQSEG